MRTNLPSKALVLVLGVILFGLDGIAEADFVIHLRDGKEIVVDQYREEGDQIRYGRFGGEVGIPRARVAIIEDRGTGEKRVLNRMYTAQEMEAIAESQAARLEEAEQRQGTRLSQVLIVWKDVLSMYAGKGSIKAGEPYSDLVACELSTKSQDKMEVLRTGTTPAGRPYFEVRVTTGPAKGCTGVTGGEHF